MNTAEAFQLIVANDKLIISQIRSGAHNATKEEIEDIKSLVTIELAERLVKDFDPSRGVKPTTYMGMVARSRALDLSRNRKNHSAFDVGADDSEDTYAYSAELASNDQGVAAFEAREELQAAFAELGDKLGGQEFVMDYFANDLEIPELCSKYGISPGTVYSRINKVRQFLKEKLG